MLLTVVAFVVIQVTNGAKPPEHYCAISKDHTMCLYRRFNSMGLRCRHYHSMPRNGVRRMMMREHNSLRNKYASNSKQQFTVPNMLGLEWDEELTEIAERWAMQCPYYEDDFRDVVRFKVANLVGIASHESSYSNLLEVWNSLVEGNMTFHKITDGPKKKFHKLESAFKLDQPLSLITNPYFKYFGCAAAIYRQFIVEDEMFRTTLVCNYGPLLATYDEVLPAGLPCTRCPNETYCHKNSSYPNLCFENMSSTLSNGEQIPVRAVELRNEMYDYSEEYEEAETTTPTNQRMNNTNVTGNAGGGNKTNNYCNIICDNGALHTLCTHENVRSLDYDEVVPILGKPSKAFIVTIHNGIRDDVAGAKGGEEIIKDLPLAANMRELVWNEELAQVAERWTMQCKGEKDECRDIYLDNDRVPTYVSQLINVNNWTGTGLFPSVTDAFFQWMVGMPFFTKDVIQPYVDPPDKKTDYSGFAQIIWAESYMIGCGMTICRKRNQTTSRVVTACNYAPGGIVAGKSVFKVGGPCSHCDKLEWKGIRGGFCSNEYLSLCSGQYRPILRHLVISVKFLRCLQVEVPGA